MRILEHIGFDEATVGELLFYMPRDCDLMVAVGTGSINDMTRFLSHRMGRPFFTVATAAPMDGFASALAVLNINHFKTSVNAQTPTAIVGDTEILKNAPYRMIAAGLGDLLGKSTCLCDWKLSRLINREHYCENLVALVENCVQQVLSQTDRVKERDPEVLAEAVAIMEETGSIDYARTFAEDLTLNAKARLAGALPPSQYRDLLVSMADWFVNRLK